VQLGNQFIFTQSLSSSGQFPQQPGKPIPEYHLIVSWMLLQ